MLMHHQVIETVLLKLYAEEDQLPNVLALVQDAVEIIIPEVESILSLQQYFGALSILLEKKGDDAQLLELWTKFVRFCDVYVVIFG